VLLQFCIEKISDWFFRNHKQRMIDAKLLCSTIHTLHQKHYEPIWRREEKNQWEKLYTLNFFTWQKVALYIFINRKEKQPQQTILIFRYFPSPLLIMYFINTSVNIHIVLQREYSTLKYVVSNWEYKLNVCVEISRDIKV
jgi:hypothetical protein